MTLAEMKQLLALATKATNHASQQLACTPNLDARIAWRDLWHDCNETMLSTKIVIDMIEEAMHDEQ